MCPVKLRALRSTFCAIQIELFPFMKPITSATEYFGGMGNQHVDVIGHQMAFFDLAFAPPRQFMEHVAQNVL